LPLTVLLSDPAQHKGSKAQNRDFLHSFYAVALQRFAMVMTSKTRPAASKKQVVSKKTKSLEVRVSRTRCPAHMTVAEWQAALRRQFGREQPFKLENLGAEPVFSDFRVHNPASQSHYRVAIRGNGAGQNFCACPDFATNHLGTCKHIEFTLAKLSAKRGGKAALVQGCNLAYSEIWLDYAGARHVRLRVGSACPAQWLAQAQAVFDAQLNWVLPWERLNELEALMAQAHAAGHEVQCHDDVWQFVAQIRDGQRRHSTLMQAYPQGVNDKALSKLLKIKLYPYQVHGALFAAQAGRALIGDEMGLGKTIQAVAAAELFARHFGVRRVLVVCPTSLKHQWKNEFERFSERGAQVISGLRAQRQQQYSIESFCKITHYDTLARDADLINAWAPELVIADEAQRIKNWNTIAARALKRIASPYAVVLTGTPLENRLEELISIVQFVDQHRLGPTWELLDKHQLRDDAGRVIGYRALDQISQTLAPVMLRRRKAEVLTQLPERVDKRIYVPLTPQQRVHHDENGDIVMKIVSRWRNTGFLSDIDQRRLQCALQNMRMSCNSTWLLDHETDHGDKVDELMAVLDEVFEDPNAKAVVFSQWLGTHELIVRRLKTRAWGHVLFNGSVPSDKRGELVTRFHDDADCRLFLSTDAGGVGLNLQHAAAVVVNMDMPWNPAVLEQRIGRVHRMGQSRGVQVINFVGQGSIEEGILSVLAFKTSLFAGVLDGGEADVFLQGTRLSKFMQSVEEAAGAMGTPEAAEVVTATVAAVPAQNADATQADLTPTAASPQTITLMAVTAPEKPSQEEPFQERAATHAAPPDPWAAMLQAGAALLSSLASSRSAGGAAPLAIEHDPVTGQASVRLPLPEPAVLHQLAKALEPWLR
jgi:superfamily II DNA or RNA helicase